MEKKLPWWVAHKMLRLDFTLISIVSGKCLAEDILRLWRTPDGRSDCWWEGREKPIEPRQRSFVCGACFALLIVPCSSIESVDLLPDPQRIVHGTWLSLHCCIMWLVAWKMVTTVEIGQLVHDNEPAHLLLLWLGMPPLCLNTAKCYLCVTEALVVRLATPFLEYHLI